MEKVGKGKEEDERRMEGWDGWDSLQVTALPYLLAGLRNLLLRKGKRREGKEGKKTKGE